jgi:DNA-binding PadR family transcriptional regulator
MTRVFGRGELKQALLHVAADLGSTNGYAIMQALGERIGGRWQPSPGAIYPALLALEDAGLLRGEDADGARHYHVTEAGQRALVAQPDVIDTVAGRAREVPEPHATVGSVLDRLARAATGRNLPIDDDHVLRLELVFRPVQEEIDRMTAKEAP